MVRFEDYPHMKKVGQQKYRYVFLLIFREDLDYLVGLKRVKNDNDINYRYKDMDEFKRKCQQMNDVCIIL